MFKKRRIHKLDLINIVVLEERERVCVWMCIVYVHVFFFSGVVKAKVLLAPDPSSLAGVRVLQKNLLYVVGLSPGAAKEEVLKKKEYFGTHTS